MHIASNVNSLEYDIENATNPAVRDSKGQVPLHRYIVLGKVDIVKQMLKKNVNLSVKDSNKRTPLHDAAYYRHVEVVKLLLEKGADPSAKKMSVEEHHYTRLHVMGM